MFSYILTYLLTTGLHCWSYSRLNCLPSAINRRIKKVRGPAVKAVTMGCLNKPEISGKNLTSITKGSNLSFLTKIAFNFSGAVFCNTPKSISAGALPGIPLGQRTALPRPLVGEEGACCPSPRTPPPPRTFRPLCLQPKTPPRINPSYNLDIPWFTSVF